MTPGHVSGQASEMDVVLGAKAIIRNSVYANTKY